MSGRFGKLRHIQAGIAAGTLQGGHHGLCRGLRGAVGQRGQGGIHNVNARLSCHKVCHVTRTGSVVRVQMNRHAHILLELLHQGIRIVGQEQVRHVLDADGVGAHFFQLHSQLYEIILAVHRALGVADGGFH